MTVKILVVAEPDFDSATVLTVLSKALENMAGEYPTLLTMGVEGAESAAVRFWKQLGRPVRVPPEFSNPYILANHLIRTILPDLVLAFGNDKRVADIVRRCGDHIDLIHMKE